MNNGGDPNLQDCPVLNLLTLMMNSRSVCIEFTDVMFISIPLPTFSMSAKSSVGIEKGYNHNVFNKG